MASPKKPSVKWNIPSPEQEEDSISDRYVYSDTFMEDKSTVQNYSDTFISESYSDTFINETSRSYTSRERGKNKDDSETENIRTMISFKNSFDESEIQDATYLETAMTGVLETVMEVDSDQTSTGITETFRTSYDDESGTHRDSYTDTFESSERTKVDSQYDVTLDSSPRSVETKSYHSISKTYSHDSESSEHSYEDESLLDRSYIAPDYDGKALTDDEDDVTDNGDDYSYTFEPTDTTSYVIQDPVKARHEAQQINLGEQTKKDFMKSLVQKLRSKPEKKFVKLETLPVETADVEEDDYVRHFCKKNVKMLKKRKQVKKEAESESESQMTETVTGKYSGELLSDYGLPDSLLERAKITNILSAMKRAAQEEIHEPKKCPQCRELKSRLDVEDAERQFVTAHARRLKNKMMDVRVEEHMLKMNSISMIAELARELPRHSEKPEKILDRLFEPLLGKNVMR